MPHVTKSEVSATVAARSQLTAGYAAAPAKDTAESDQIRRAQQGDVSAYEELVRKHQRRVMSIVGGILRWREDVEDVAQQVFLKVYLSIQRFDGRSSFSTWLYKITLNETYDHLRKKKARRLVYESDLSEEQVRHITETAGSTRPGNPSPLALERIESRQMVNQLLMELSPEDRMMLVLKEVEGFSVQEISEMTSQNTNTVKVRMFRARRRLAELYRKRFGSRGR
jgi:RNA polymerase sigma-70 factor (ECF subfamily)